MRDTIHLFLLLFLTGIGMHVWAQQKTGNKAGDKTKKVQPNLFRPDVYFNGSNYAGGDIHKKDFDSLLKQGLEAHDSVGNKYKIVGFDFTYAERMLYEDSVGNLQVMVDYLNEYCPGDTVAGDISGNIYDRTKGGDTVFIDHAQLLPYPGNTLLSPADTSLLGGRGMKCVIIK